MLLNGQNIDDFNWTKNEHASIFIQHSNKEQYWLSKANMGDDLLKKAATNSLWQQPNPMSSMLLYQGRNILSLRNSVVYFTLINERWYLSSRALDVIDGGSSVFDGLIETQALSSDAQLNIHQDNHGEILLFDNQKSRMYALQLGHIQQMETAAPVSNTNAPETNNFVLYLSFLTVAGLVIIFAYRKKTERGSSKDSLSNEYVRYRYEPTTHNILLYRTNRKNEHSTLALKDITRCDVLLNGKVISTIDADAQHVISNQSEKNIRAAFIEEHSDTLHDEITRHIEVVFFSVDNRYPVSVYLRKGNTRLTGSKYYEAVDVLMDICWIISKKINPKLTETRLLPKSVRSARNAKARSTAVPKAQNERSVSKPVTAVQAPEIAKVQPDGQVVLQTGVVDSLDKLVNLHQQGYLNDEEFKAAKSKLLQSLLGS